MSTYIGLIGTDYQTPDRRWLLASPRVKPSVTYDISKFNQTGTNAVQTITVTGGAGTMVLGDGHGNTTSPLPYNASLAAVQAALQSLPGIGSGFEGLAPIGSSGYQQYPGGVSVTGTPGSSYVVTFQGALANVQVPALTAVGSGGATTAVASTTAGVTAHYPKGYIPSGVALGQVAATQLYGPYDPTASDGRQHFKGFGYGDVRAVWLAGGTQVIADKVGTGLVCWDAMVSLSHLPFQGGPGSLDANGQAAIPSISYQA